MKRGKDAPFGGQDMLTRAVSQLSNACNANTHAEVVLGMLTRGVSQDPSLVLTLTLQPGVE